VRGIYYGKNNYGITRFIGNCHIMVGYYRRRTLRRLMLIKTYKKGGLFSLLLIFSLFTTTLFSKTIVINDDVIIDKTVKRINIMGQEMLDQVGVTTIIVAKKKMNKEEFLKIKEEIFNDLKKSYIVWFFSRKYDDSQNIGLNQIFISDDLEGKFDSESLTSPFYGTFTKVLTANSKLDTTSAAFFNAYGDIMAQIGEAYNVEFKNAVPNDGRTFINIVRAIFYGTLAYGLYFYIRRKYFQKKS
jgi:hypothetical protein